jgi:hypothetical protein
VGVEVLDGAASLSRVTNTVTAEADERRAADARGQGPR